MLTPGPRPTLGAGINLQSSRPGSRCGHLGSYVQWNSSTTSLFPFLSLDACLVCQHCYFLLLSLTSIVILENILKLPGVLVSLSRHWGSEWLVTYMQKPCSVSNECELNLNELPLTFTPTPLLSLCCRGPSC